MATASGIRVRLPAAFRAAAGGRAEVRVQGGNVGEALAALCRAHPELAGRLLGPDGAPRRYVSLFVNDEDVRQLGGVEAPLEDGDELTVVPALSGGGGGAPAGREAGVQAPATPLQADALQGALARIARLAEASPGVEVCGFVLRSPDGEGLEIIASRNVAKDAARSFEVDPADALRALRRGDEQRRALVALYHSHPAGGASLSALDAAQLTVAGRPLLPGAELWVVGLQRGAAVEIRAYRWSGEGYAERDRRTAPFTARERDRGAQLA